MAPNYGLTEAKQIAQQIFPTFTTPVRTEASWQEPLEAWYLWQRARGGGALLVSGQDGSFLFANSSVPMDEHFAEFSKGRRNDPALLSDL